MASNKEYMPEELQNLRLQLQQKDSVINDYENLLCEILYEIKRSSFFGMSRSAIINKATQRIRKLNRRWDSFSGNAIMEKCPSCKGALWVDLEEKKSFIICKHCLTAYLAKVDNKTSVKLIENKFISFIGKFLYSNKRKVREK